MNRFNPNSKNSFNQKFREKRFQFFKTLLSDSGLVKPINILDIGGFQTYWERMNFIEDVNITLVNLDDAPVTYKNFRSINCDARDMAIFEDKHFDVVFSNSMIEHLFTIENQQKVANEARRVGKYYFIQTPNKHFPIEPHWLFPFFQYLPFSTRVLLTEKFNLGNYKKAIDKKAAEKRVSEVRLLTIKEMKNLFPEGRLYKEKLLGFTKSIVMYNFPAAK